MPKTGKLIISLTDAETEIEGNNEWKRKTTRDRKRVKTRKNWKWKVWKEKGIKTEN